MLMKKHYKLPLLLRETKPVSLVYHGFQIRLIVHQFALCNFEILNDIHCAKYILDESKYLRHMSLYLTQNTSRYTL